MIRFAVDGTKHEFDPDRLTFGECRALEKVTGYPFKDLDRHMQAGEITSLQAVIWVAMRRDNNDLSFSDLDDLPLGDIEFDEEDEPDPTEGDGSTTVA